MRAAGCLISLAASTLYAQPQALTFHWATACHEPLDPQPVFVPKSLTTILLPGQCMEVTGERSGYEGGFSPMMDGDRLLLIVLAAPLPPAPIGWRPPQSSICHVALVVMVGAWSTVSIR